MARKRYSKKTSLLYFVLTALVLSTLTSARLSAQVAGATMSGTITDVTGAIIPTAQASIRNVATGVVRAVKTDSAGFYTAPNLLPGKYEVTVSARGFKTEVRKGITLTVGAQQVLNITMQVGQVTQTVQVTGAAPAVQLASSTIAGVVNQTAVVSLPLNGRDWTLLATLQPGVESLGSIQASPGSKDRSHRGYGVQMSISGTRPQFNNYRIDGISVNDYANGGPGSVAGATLGVDAIQEFSVITSNYSAEYGRTSGGVVNALTQSGTNKFHGDAYEFLRNSNLDAANFFDNFNNTPKPPFRQNQFGASLGGPIWKNHTFFFADYEGFRQNEGVTAIITVPSQALRNGILCSIPQPGGCSTSKVSGSPNPDPATGIDKAVLPYLSLWALPNAGLVGNGDTGIYSATSPFVTSENFLDARVDHNFSDKDTAFGTYEYDPAASTQPSPEHNLIIGNNTGRSLFVIEETHSFSPQWVNSVRLGYNRSVHTNRGVSAINPAAADPSLGVIPGQDNPQMEVPGVQNISGGLNQTDELDFWNNSFQGYDDAFLTKGIHSLTSGIAVERIQLNEFNAAPASDFPFNSLIQFLTNQPSTLGAPVPGHASTELGIRSTIFGAYVQDNIRLRPNLTINAGLRYEMSTVPSEVHGQLSVLRSPVNQSLQTAHIGNGIFLENPTLHNFMPRVGFAWDPFGNGKTSIRGGFGMFDVLPLPFFLGQIASAAAPFGVETGLATNLSPGDFPTLAVAKTLAGPLQMPYVEPNPGRSYVMQWNLNVQREILPGLTTMIAYVGNRGVHMPFRSDDINTVQPALTSAGYLWPNPALTTNNSRLSPNVGQMDDWGWNNDSYFDALEVQVTKRMSHGFQVEGSYTWSKAIDGGDGSIASDAYVNAIPALFYFSPRYRRGPSDFNVTHNLTINYLWNIPTPRSFSGPAAWVAHGWQLGGILQVRSGLPFTPLISGDPLGLLSSTPEAYPDRLAGSGCGSQVNPGNVTNYLKLQCFGLPVSTPAITAQCVPFGTIAGTCSNLLGNGGRNEVYGPGMVDFDFSLVKNTKIKESVTLQFRAEFFNLLNHSNFLSPIDNSAVFDQFGNPVGGAGLIDQTSTSSRQIQFALKLIF